MKELSEWLGKAGRDHFQGILEEFGTINAVYNDGGIPHVVHFREGMMVRNKLRELIPNMPNSWYDDNWVRLVEEVLAEKLA